jgi:hypothetical protein
MHKDSSHDLGTWPGPNEILQAEYPEWQISREVDSPGRHGHWVARHFTACDRVLRAADIPSLSALLAKDAMSSQASGNASAAEADQTADTTRGASPMTAPHSPPDEHVEPSTGSGSDR